MQVYVVLLLYSIIPKMSILLTQLRMFRQRTNILNFKPVFKRFMHFIFRGSISDSRVRYSTP